MSNVYVDHIRPRDESIVSVHGTLSSSSTLKIPTVTFPDGTTQSTAPVASNPVTLTKLVQFTSSGTYTPSSGTSFIRVIVHGSHGTGVQNVGYESGTNPGGHGGRVEKLITTPAVATVTIGTTAGSATGSSHPGYGGNTSFADGTNTLTAGGGQGGKRGLHDYYGPDYTAYPGDDGTATGGDINIEGGSDVGKAASHTGGSGVVVVEEYA
tara:strand:- start:8726 stop:9355 length:630 start_codon:yes stop_codon:yes gene_type:complete